MNAQMVLEFDTPEWRRIRDEKLREWIQNDHAVQWLIDFGQVCEVVDDLIDRDKPVADSAISGLLFATLVEMPNNLFFQANRAVLSGIVVTGINAWLDANTMERTQYAATTKYAEMEELIRAFSLRGWYVEIISAILYITRGPTVMREISLEVRAFFNSESFVDYAARVAHRDAPLAISEAAE